MTALVFPTSPTVGQGYSSKGRSWVWDGIKWGVSSGQTIAPTFIGCRAVATALQNIPDVTYTAVLFDSEAFPAGDTDAIHSVSVNTSRFTINEAGWYVGGGGGYFVPGGFNWCRANWRLNGTTTLPGTEHRTLTSNTLGINVYSAIPATYFAVGDYLELMVYHDSGFAVDFGATALGVNSASAYIYKVNGIVGPVGTVLPTQTLTDAATIDWNTLIGPVAKVTLGGNRTLAAPTNLQDGGTYILRVIQDGTGSRTLAYNAVYKWPGGTDPVLSTAAASIDIISFVSDGTNMYGVAQLAFAT